ncbi:MAG TPA: hypothetical protein VMW42_00855, partial [Desulfatiglandales bacterium]|nr:hypothetical protein [Desulfatiglandales bacterium]
KDQLSPYIESFPEGWIDWENGIIYGVGKGFLKQNNNSKNKSLRAGQLIAQQSILKVAARIRLNGRQTLETLEKESGVINLKAFIRSEEHQTVFESNDDQPHFKVTLKAPLTGIEGLTVRLLDHLRTKPSAWQDFPKPPDKRDVEDEEAPWLVLDARQLMVQNGVKPALFPKIISASGQTIYDLKTVEEDALAKRGMAKYVVSDMSREQLSLRKNSIDKRITALFESLYAQKAYAEEERKKRKRSKFIVTEVAQAQGLMKTNLIISEDDARKVSAEDASSRILKKCRVIILMSSSVGGVEGSIPRYLAFN